MKLALVIIIFLFDLTVAQSQGIAFPGAEGYGRLTTGGRGGKVMIVTNLEDEGPGSLREALRKKYPRIVVFAISGTIELESDLDINHGDLTIAGQSAPGDGITLKNYPIKVKGNNVIIRYIRSRMGDEKGEQDDAITVKNQKNVIVDHCSFSWATDECASFYDNEEMTVQWCIISESLNNSVHSKGAHGYGGIWGGMNASFHHNLFAHHLSRNPRLQGARYHRQPEREIADFRNNVIYNWGENNVYAGEEGNYNLINNYYKSGPGTSSKKDKILDPYEPYGQFFVEGNILEEDSEVTNDNWEGVKIDEDKRLLIRLDNPLDVAEIRTQPADEAFEVVLKNVGANYCQDAVDKRVIEEVRKGTATYGNGIIDSQKDVGGWPVLKSKMAPKDADQDGMPDKWERKKGLNVDGDDSAGYDMDSVYTNIEVYLNELVSQE
ncbi:polysaccharide lyase family 1 protein [Marinoscillum sp. MHG1-6]|uniref:pectate lyase family protein n=1 Tax=Marinoscillum sp. MHG1-6 TaxID=2959627 RepID=UPI002157E7F7|nr:pectate lyase [Marinoscillum sp. MHG1-6]